MRELNPPATMTELKMRLCEEERKKLLLWLTTPEMIEGKEIRVDLSQWNAGLLGSFVCEIKRWEPNRTK